jgi:hypothetical protein
MERGYEGRGNRNVGEAWGEEGLYDVEEWEKIGSNSEKMSD